MGLRQEKGNCVGLQLDNPIK